MPGVFRKLGALSCFVVTTAVGAQTRLPSLRGPDWGPRLLREDARYLEGVPSRDDVRAKLRQLLATPLLDARSNAAATALRGLGSRGRQNFRFFHGDTPVCGFSVVSNELADGRNLSFGRMPVLAVDAAPPSREWPDEARAAASVSRAWVLSNGAASDWRKTDASRCYALHAGGLVPAWRMWFLIDGLPYLAVADAARVYAMEKRYFEVNGTARVHEFNDVSTPDLSDIALKGLTGDGSLSDSKSRLVVPSGTPPAIDAGHNFVFDPESEKFAQASAFTHAQQHRLWFESLGVEWRGTKPLEIKLHIKPGGRSNNALYTPENGTFPASIGIDDGDGKVLQNLALDADVVSHELGHHVVYSTLKRTEGESLVLHEAMADFFIFARADNPCLGESICPENGTACILRGQCLRSGALELTYGDDNWQAFGGANNTLGHLHSQLISGLLWDFRREQLIGVDDLAKLALRAVSLLNEDSGFADFLAALLSADEELQGGKHVGKLRALAAARGLDSFLPAADPSAGGGEVSDPVGGAATATSTSTDTVVKTEDTQQVGKDEVRGDDDDDEATKTSTKTDTDTTPTGKARGRSSGSGSGICGVVHSGGLNSGGLNSGGLNSGGLNSGGLNSGGLNSGGLNSGVLHRDDAGTSSHSGARLVLLLALAVPLSLTAPAAVMARRRHRLPNSPGRGAVG